MFKTNFSGHNKIWEGTIKSGGHGPECPPMDTGLGPNRLDLTSATLPNALSCFCLNLIRLQNKIETDRKGFS